MDRRKKYTHDDVMLVIAEFVLRERSEKDLSIPVELLYEDIKGFASLKHPDVQMPKFSMARKMIIAELTESALFQTGERLTADVLYRLKKVYYDDAVIENVLQKEYDVSCYAGDIIVCTLELPPDDIIKKLMQGISENKGKSALWGKINTIQKICTIIKERDPDNILAVIPETNRMVYINDKGQINSAVKDLEPICSTLCMFVKKTPEGQAIIESFKQKI